MEGSRGDYKEVIVEEFIKFDSEITLLTVTQKNGNTLFCPPIGHRQERGDYQESWQPFAMSELDLKDAQLMAAKVTEALTGFGIWGVEFFLTTKGVYFSELSPRPHDTGMVTLAGTQNLSEFELHARAILGYPIPEIKLLCNGSSAVLLAHEDGETPIYRGIEDVLINPNADIRIFNKPTKRKYRRMGVVLVNGDLSVDVTQIKEKAIQLSKLITIK
jgi:phosphoribosylglycinamide formyltransferase 2